MSWQEYWNPWVLLLSAALALISVLWPRTPIPLLVMALWIITWAGYTIGAGILDYAILRGVGMGIALYLAHSLLAATDHVRRHTALDRETILTWAQNAGGVLVISGALAGLIWAITTYAPALPNAVSLPLGLLSAAIVIYLLARMLHRSAYESAE